VELQLLKWVEARARAFADAPEELQAVREDLCEVAGVAQISHKAAGVLVRNVIERLVRSVHNAELGNPKGKPLFDMIESLREKGKLPPKVASYLHTIRRIGDDAAHFEVSRDDLLAVLLPLLLVIEWYFCSFEKGPRAETIYSSDRSDDSPPAAEMDRTAIEHAELIEQLVALARQSRQAFNLRLWVEREDAARVTRDFAPDPQEGSLRFRLGDKAVICASADRDCYLWIIDVGTTGRNAIIFPPRPSEDNWVRANQVVRIAGTLTGKAGLETIHAFASSSPAEISSLSGQSGGRAVRDFVVQEESAIKSSSADRAAATIQFAIGERLEEIK
jgi:uncharacterized protein DUF4145/uncharacterized protein DUF4384